MAKRKNPYVYPQEDDRRTGCKVSWLYYKDQKMAEKAALVARKEAMYKESQGYDFGYQCPGHVTYYEDWKGMGPMYSVCIP